MSSTGASIGGQQIRCFARDLQPEYAHHQPIQGYSKLLQTLLCPPFAITYELSNGCQASLQQQFQHENPKTCSSNRTAYTGSVTPWQTHLGSEEFEPDAKLLADFALEAPEGQEWLEEEEMAAHIIPYMGHNDTLSNADAAALAHPYLYGYIWEVRRARRDFPFLVFFAY